MKIFWRSSAGREKKVVRGFGIGIGVVRVRSMLRAEFVNVVGANIVGANMPGEGQWLENCKGRKGEGGRSEGRKSEGRKGIRGGEGPDMETAFQKAHFSSGGSVFKVAKRSSPLGPGATIGDGGAGAIDAISVFKAAIIAGAIDFVLGLRVCLETLVFLEVRPRTVVSASPRRSGSPVMNTRLSITRHLVISRDVETVVSCIFVFDC